MLLGCSWLALGQTLPTLIRETDHLGLVLQTHRFGVSIRKCSKEMGEESWEETKCLGDLHKPTQLKGNSTKIFQLMEINFTLCNFCSKSQKNSAFQRGKAGNKFI